ncbi:50S ribosomal protein L34 [Capsicum annuum]|uniref:Large ribosomal subunit protein bL34c n=1 Tax=Capsicum annuum TaxID=4072 RepID=A0A1U8FLP5_CAPAN|nr:50S ribosomal protein L34, chloroplastic [Capsicum annuum]KAF3629273.1 50S ribosomal protein L34 [Capsicum annuum]KAF3631050.1 50S ribosomal protein L34 [Capsicum annuum]PHT94974.1 50S ribosomal protein L34 [Capsicum annuum]
MACLSVGSWVCSGIGGIHRTSASSRSLLTVTAPSSRMTSLKMASTCPGLLHCSFLPSSPLSTLSASTSFSGSSLGLGFGFNSNIGVSTTKRRGLVVMAKKYALCQTKRNRSRKSLARTHGFRKRMSTTSGRATIQRRRAKGRWDLCPKSSPRTGKKA